ncbi:3-oxoacyl-ACP synthase III family protein [Floridanema evergladense]|uniref:3-oxoacyl-ACP synthase III family protein n=1 Tax=Floridaenema evergladense BLCC-F167 TaxID=3153639 RepID=A0ABV4WWN0_9CYAN
MYQPVGIRSVAVSFPSVVRTNDYFRQNYPELVEKAEQKSLARAFSPLEFTTTNQEVDLWTQEMMPYLSDPFRGIIERRVLSSTESSLTLEYDAASQAIEAAKLSPEEIDVMLVTSLFPEKVVPGDAAFLAGKLGLRGAAWNLESTCTSALVALQTACALIKAGEYRNVLVVLSTTFSRFVDENDTFSFLMGDGAGAFVVTSLEANQGVLNTKIIHTAETCNAFFNEFAIDSQGNPRTFIRVGKDANKMLRDLFVKFCRNCCEDVIANAGITLDQVDFFVSNTNTAWYSSVYTKALGIDPKRTINLNSVYANIGAASPIANLYHAAQLGKIRENDLVLIYTFGGTSNAGATLIRWGDVALGPLPATSPSLMKVMAGTTITVPKNQ